MGEANEKQGQESAQMASLKESAGEEVKSQTKRTLFRMADKQMG
jgi:hypothetical protein